jgi:hypothetical protein
MTVAELINQLRSLHADTIVTVWDFAEGGLVEANEVETSYDERGHTVCIAYNRINKDTD